MTASIHTISRPSSNANPDAGLLDLVARHDALFIICDGDAEPTTEELAELCDLERQIVARPCFTGPGLAGKQRVVARAAFDDDDQIIAEIMRLDVERVTG